MWQGQQRKGVKGDNAKDEGDSRKIKEMNQQHSKTDDANKFDSKKLSGHHGYVEKKVKLRKRDATYAEGCTDSETTLI